MNKYLYDAATNAFYPLSEKDAYQSAGLWPKTGVEVDEDTFASFQQPPSGKVRIAGEDGAPAWADIPPPTKEQYVSLAKQEQQQLILEANVITANWMAELTLGIISDEDKASLIEWLNYIKAVQAVDTSTAPDINWPVKPGT